MTDAIDFEIQRMTALEQQRRDGEARHSGYDEQHAKDQEWLDDLWQWTVAADPEDYNAWLTGHLRAGGKVSHFYSYEMPAEQWFVANVSFEIRPLYGSASINVIVREGVAVTGKTGHNSLYLMDGFASRGFHDSDASVPVFTNNHLLGAS